MSSILKAKLADYDDRGFDLVRRHVFITSELPMQKVDAEFSDARQRRWRDGDVAGHNNAVALAEHFFLLVQQKQHLESG